MLSSNIFQFTTAIRKLRPPYIPCLHLLHDHHVHLALAQERSPANFPDREVKQVRRRQVQGAFAIGKKTASLPVGKFRAEQEVKSVNEQDHKLPCGQKASMKCSQRLLGIACQEIRVVLAWREPSVTSSLFVLVEFGSHWPPTVCSRNVFNSVPTLFSLCTINQNIKQNTISSNADCSPC